MIQTIFLMGASGGAGQQGGNPLMSFLPLIMIIAIMYFLLLRPQFKRQKEQKQMLENLQKGDKILTAGGIVGTIAGIRESDGMLIVKISENVKVDMTKTSVVQVLSK